MTVQRVVAGVDEVGRGPLAGPVVAAAVVLPRQLPPSLADAIGDSKALAASVREALAGELRACRGVEIGIGAASVLEIAARNILGATLLAMRRAVLRLPRPPDLVLVDGNRPPRLDCSVRCIVGGDATEPAIGAASILAKVLRDRLMTRLALRYPGYGWERNAGYPTASHHAALQQLGPTPHHRAGFGPVARLLAGSGPARG
ncbi:MAG: ribonuclease HII [Rhodospirillales bacterium]|nr:ribonuclease HII [Rhodospirillales bacterium]